MMLQVNGIKLARMKAGLRQIDLAKSVGCSESLVAHWETGRAKPQDAVLDKLAKILNTETSELLQEYDLAPVVSEKC